MPYDRSDPRAQLSSATAPTGIPRSAHYRELGASKADEHHLHGSSTWWTRSQALVIAYTDAVTGDELVTDNVDGEHVVLVLRGASVDVGHDGDTVSVTESAVVVVPPGTSQLRIAASGTVVRVFAAETAPALAGRCANASEYIESDDNVASFERWPTAVDGNMIRVYPIAASPITEGRLGRIFRCSTVMVNVLGETDGPRDASKLSPHHHDDFEQVSLQIDGDYVHHMRVSWSPDSGTWRDDEHRRCTAPAIVVIPPPLIHTSQAVGDTHHWLIDVFSPPRRDFSERPGWVLNAAEYPMP